MPSYLLKKCPYYLVIAYIFLQIFFFKAQVISGEIQNKTKSKDKTTEYKDLAWLTREELISKLQPEYHKQISEFLIDEEN